MTLQGFGNQVLNFALLFETSIALLITYVPPLNTVWRTVPLNVLYLLVGTPYFVFIIIYDELRKVGRSLIRARVSGSGKDCVRVSTCWGVLF